MRKLTGVLTPLLLILSAFFASTSFAKHSQPSHAVIPYYILCSTDVLLREAYGSVSDPNGDHGTGYIYAEFDARQQSVYCGYVLFRYNVFEGSGQCNVPYNYWGNVDNGYYIHGPISGCGNSVDDYSPPFSVPDGTYFNAQFNVGGSGTNTIYWQTP